MRAVPVGDVKADVLNVKQPASARGGGAHKQIKGLALGFTAVMFFLPVCSQTNPRL